MAATVAIVKIYFETLPLIWKATSFRTLLEVSTVQITALE